MMQPPKFNPHKNPQPFNGILNTIRTVFHFRWYFGKHPGSVPNRAIILFPCLDNVLGCGLVGIVHVKNASSPESDFHLPPFEQLTGKLRENGYFQCTANNRSIADHYLGDEPTVDSLSSAVRSLKKIESILCPLQ
jgi:hypothetical protein